MYHMRAYTNVKDHPSVIVCFFVEYLVLRYHLEIRLSYININGEGWVYHLLIYLFIFAGAIE